MGTSRHLIVACVVGEHPLVLAFGHDGVIEELAARIEEGKDG